MVGFINTGLLKDRFKMEKLISIWNILWKKILRNFSVIYSKKSCSNEPDREDIMGITEKI